eukprot:Gb_00070 [translate_table: standard]
MFRETLSDNVQQKIAHCNSSENFQRFLCEILDALNAQGSDDDADLSKIHNDIRLQNVCRFKSEGGHELHRYASPRSAELQTVLDRYVAMHRRCTALEFDNITNIYNNGEHPACRYVIWGAGNYGFGNRLISLISAFLYAILSQRVLLIDYPDWSLLFCDPFEGSPWRIPIERPLDLNLGVSYLSFKDAGCGFQNSTPGPINSCATTIVNMALHHVTPVRELEFLICPSGISRLRNVAFVTMRASNQYFAPGFFLNPALGPVMKLLFPERNPFHVLSKFLLSPGDHVWDAIRHYAQGTLAQATRRIGVQIREFRYGYTAGFDRNVLLCIRRKAGFCPLEFRTDEKNMRSYNRDEYFSVYVATLAQGHIANLNETLGIVRNETGKSFRVLSQQLDGKEIHDSSHAQEALIDMWVLSLSDVLLTSRMSTFGYVAQGLGGIIPYFISSSENEMCEMNAGSDPCYHYAPKQGVCKDDLMGNASARELSLQSQAVTDCVDYKETGWQLVPPF